MKIEYYGYMVQYYVHEKELLETAKAYQIIYDTINKDHENLDDQEGSQRTENFRNFLLYLLMSPYSTEKVDLMNVVESMYPRELEKEQDVSKFVRKLLTYELMPLEENKIEEQMKKFEPFRQNVTANAKSHLLEFLKQLVQHNIRVIQKYYSKIRLERISQLIGVSVERTEKEIGDMVVNKRIQAKINRLSGIVVFSQRKQFTNEKLDGWNHDTRSILDKVEQTCHLINRDKVE